MNFDYNEHGVCLNPQIVFEAISPKHGRIKIKVSEKDNKWTFGYSYNYTHKGTGGVSSPCSFHDFNTFLSKDEAIEQSIERICRSQYFEIGDSCEWHLQELQKFKNLKNQLSLF